MTPVAVETKMRGSPSSSPDDTTSCPGGGGSRAKGCPKLGASESNKPGRPAAPADVRGTVGESAGGAKTGVVGGEEGRSWGRGGGRAGQPERSVLRCEGRYPPRPEERGHGPPRPAGCQQSGAEHAEAGRAGGEGARRRQPQVRSRERGVQPRACASRRPRR